MRPQGYFAAQLFLEFNKVITLFNAIPQLRNVQLAVLGRRHLFYPSSSRPDKARVQSRPGLFPLFYNKSSS
jgi:hypothetical protein